MSSKLDQLEQHFTASRDRILARSKQDTSQPVTLLGWRIVTPTRPTELYTAYFLWPNAFGLIFLFLPSLCLILRSHPTHTRLMEFAADALLAGHRSTARLYMVLDIFVAHVAPYLGVMFITLIQVLLFYSSLSMYFWNRRARRLQANPSSAPASTQGVWPPPPTI